MYGDSDQTRLTMYLSLLRESDNALRELCEYFKTYDDKTIILFFGDHQPADIVAKQILKLNGKTINEDSIEEREIPILYHLFYGQTTILKKQKLRQLVLTTFRLYF